MSRLLLGLLMTVLSGCRQPFRGEWIWTEDQRLGAISTSFGMADGRIYFGTWRGSLHVIDILSRSPAFSFQTGAEVYSSPAIADDRIFFSSFDLNIYAVSLTGEKLWAARTEDRVKNPLVTDGATVFASIRGTAVRALSAQDGHLLWESRQEALAGSTSDLVLSDRVLYVGDLRRSLAALDAGTGTPLWVVPFANVLTSRPALGPDQVFVGFRGVAGRSSGVVALSRRDGLELWRKEIPYDDARAPTYFDNRVVFGTTDGRVVCLDAENGAEIWTANMEWGNASTSIVSLQEVLYLATEHRKVVLLSAKSGRVLAKFPSAYGLSNPMVSRDGVYFGTGGDGLIRIRPRDVAAPDVGTAPGRTGSR